MKQITFILIFVSLTAQSQSRDTVEIKKCLIEFLRTNEGIFCRENLETHYGSFIIVEKGNKLVFTNLEKNQGSNQEVEELQGKNLKKKDKSKQIAEEILMCKYKNLHSILNYKSIEETSYQVGDRILSPQINFSYDGGCRVEQASYDSLEILAGFIRKNQYLQLEIGLHMDLRGSQDFNKDLSEYRARNLEITLRKKFDLGGIKNFSIRGYGENEPIFPYEEIEVAQEEDLKEKLHRKNRRIEIKILQVE